MPFLFKGSFTPSRAGTSSRVSAGEYSFSLALTSRTAVPRRVRVRCRRTGRLRWLAAVPLCGDAAVPRRAGAWLCGHCDPAGLLGHWNRNTWRVLPPRWCGRRHCSAAFWLVPFAADLRYSSSMGYTRVPLVSGPTSSRTVTSGSSFPRRWRCVSIAIVRRDRTPIAFTVATGGRGRRVPAAAGRLRLQRQVVALPSSF